MLLEIKENKDRGVYTSSYIYKDTYTKSPDEWATTKQACRDELVDYLCFSSHIIKTHTCTACM